MDEPTQQQIQEMQERIAQFNQKEKLALAEMQKLPVDWDRIDRQVQEHYEAHGQVNPNTKNLTL